MIAWAAITGILGVILTLAWTSTRHVFWFRNENLLLFNPLSVWLAVAAVLSLRNARYSKGTAQVAAVVAATSVVALVAKAIPGFTQNNLALILLVVPPNVAIAIGLWRTRRDDAPAIP